MFHKQLFPDNMLSFKQSLKYTWFHPRYLANRSILAALTRLAPYAHGALLDLGCGTRPYTTLFAPYVTGHIGIDVPASIHGTHQIDLAGSALRLPFANETFDTVLATEVMEHVPDPLQMLAEIRRILTRGGVLILSVPLHEPLHELPYDYYRYTPIALRYLLEQQGFTVERIETRGGPLIVSAYLVCAFLYRMFGSTGYPQAVRPRPLSGPAIVVLCAVIQIIASCFDQIARDDYDTLGYALAAYKSG